MALKLKTGRKEFTIERCEDRDKKKSTKNPVVASYKVIALTPSEIHKIFSECEEEFFYTVPNKKKEIIRDVKVNSIKFIKERAKKTIKGWEGLVAENDAGKEEAIPYSEEMIEVLYDMNPDEINWLLEKVDEISGILDKKEEEEVKN